MHLKVMQLYKVLQELAFQPKNQAQNLTSLHEDQTLQAGNDIHP